MTSLRQRVLEELQRRNYSTETTRGYIHAIKEFAEFFGKSPDLPSRFIQADSVRISKCASLAGNRMVFTRRCHAVLIPAVSFACGIAQAIEH